MIPNTFVPRTKDVTPKPYASLEVINNLVASVGYYIVFGLIICFLINTASYMKDAPYSWDADPYEFKDHPSPYD